MTRKICLFGFILIAAFSYAAPAIQSFPQVTVDQYRDFLYGDWKADRPTVLVFKDPFCPYCLRDIPRLSEIQDYNVFLFWSPILGPSSIQKVDDIFKCSDVVGDGVLNQVKNREPVSCTGKINAQRKSVNDAMVAAYDINAVPSYFLQGKRVSRSFLTQTRKQTNSINGVVVDWNRYSLFQHRSNSMSNNLVMLLPANEFKKFDALDQKYKPQYVFPIASKKSIKRWAKSRCKAGVTDVCKSENTENYRKKSDELLLLLGLDKVQEPILFDLRGIQLQ